MLPADQCAQLEYIADVSADDEHKIAAKSATDVQFRLKSVRDIIDYLGAMIRDKQNGEFKSGESTFFKLTASPTGTADGEKSRIDIAYVDGSTCHVGTGQKDYTSEVLGILTELVNARKLSSDIATTKQVQVIP